MNLGHILGSTCWTLQNFLGLEKTGQKCSLQESAVDFHPISKNTVQIQL